MTKRSTKRALAFSFISLLLCISMFVGSTFAWFTDSVTSANNVIKSGNLDIELEYWNGTEWKDVKDQSDILTNELFEPGVVEIAYLRVANAGSLALKYQLGINIVSETAGVNKDGNPFLLSDYIQFGVVEGVNGETNAYANREDAVDAVAEAKKISAGYTKADSMASGDELYLALVVYMPTTVDNVANHNGVTVPQIDLGINVFATQVEAESDSYGPDYDAAAPWTGMIDTTWYNTTDTEFVLNSAEDLAGLAQIVNTTDETFVGKTIKLDRSINLNNLEWTAIGTFDYNRTGDGSYANVDSFKGTFDGQGNTVYNLKINTPAVDGAGLFASVEAATINNLNVHNVDIVASSHAAAIVGRAHTYGKLTTITNCHVTGDVSIVIDWAYAGAVIAKASNLNISNCSVKPNGIGVITASNRNAVGSIVGWVEQPSNIIDCDAENMTLTGWANVGAISGILAAGSTMNGCTAENIVLRKTRTEGLASIGVATGGWVYGSNSINITDNSFKNITLIGTATTKANDSTYYLYGSEYSGNTNCNVVADNNTEEDIVNNIVIYGGTIDTVASAEDLQIVLDNATENTVIQLTDNISGDVTLPQSENVKVVIDGKGKTFAGNIIVNGKSSTIMSAGLTIQNVVFSTDTIVSGDACIQLGNGTNATRYTCNVTVDNCTFDVPGVVGVKSYTGGDKNLTIINCTATERAHSLAQLKGIEGVLVKDCTINSVRGINFNNSLNIVVENCTIDVEKYALRFGESANTTVENYEVKDCTIISANGDGDAAIVLRAGATNANLTITNTSIAAGVQMSGHENANITIQ